MPLDMLVTGGRIATLAGDRGFGWVEAVGITRRPGRLRRLRGRPRDAGRSVHAADRAGARRGRDPGPDRRAPPPRRGRPRARPDRPDRQRDARGRPRASSRAAHARRRSRRVARRARLGHRPLGRLADRRRPRARRAGPGVALWAHDHHALLASRAALAVAGVDRGHGRSGRRGHPPRRRRRARRASCTRPRRGSSVDTSRRRRAELVESSIVRARPGPRPRSASSPSTTRAALSPRTGLGLGDRGLPRAGRARTSCRSASTPRSGPSSSTPRSRPGCGAGDRSARIRRPGPGRLAEVLRRRVARVADRRPARADRAEAGRPLPAGTERGVWLDADPRSSRRSPRRRPRPGSRPRSTRSATPRSGPRSTPSSRPPAGPPLMPRLEHVQLAPSRRSRRGSAGPGSRPRSSRSTSGRTPRGPPRCGATGPRRAATRGARSLRPARSSPSAPTRRSSRSTRGPGIAMAVTRVDASWPAGTRALRAGRGARRSSRRSGRRASAPAIAAARGGSRPAACRASAPTSSSSRRAALSNPVEPGGALATARPRLVLIDGEVAFER